MSIYISLFTAAIPVNYTSQFLERFEAARYLFRHVATRSPSCNVDYDICCSAQNQTFRQFFLKCKNQTNATVVRTIWDVFINTFIVKSSPLN